MLLSSGDQSGDGLLDMKEFRKEVLALGVQASPQDIDKLFRSLDDDGGGSMDMNEIKKALKVLHDAAESNNKTLRTLQEQVVATWREMQMCQAAYKKMKQAEETAAAAAAEQEVAEAKAKAAAAAERIAARQAKEAEKLAKAQAMAADFAAKINEKRRNSVGAVAVT